MDGVRRGRQGVLDHDISRCLICHGPQVVVWAKRGEQDLEFDLLLNINCWNLAQVAVGTFGRDLET